MPSPNGNSAEMQAWLARVNKDPFGTSSNFGSGNQADDEQGNPTDKAITGAGRDVSSDGSLDSNS